MLNMHGVDLKGQSFGEKMTLFFPMFEVVATIITLAFFILEETTS
jgi:hypothetical protein